jgi:HAD superfamily hydrolase (TIGR01509 family)
MESILNHSLLPALNPDFPGAIFDCDGTLADTMPLHYRAWAQALEAYDAHFPEQLFYDLGGVPTVDLVHILNERFGYTLPAEETAHAKEALYEVLLPHAAPVPMVVELVRAYHGRVPQAVASGGLRRLVDKTVAALGLTDHFHAVCTAEDVPRGKPEPDLFLLAAERMGVPAKGCLVFEDSDLGLEAARRAGMVGVDVRPWVPSAHARWKMEEERRKRPGD